MGDVTEEQQRLPLRSCTESGCAAIFRPKEDWQRKCPRHRGEASKPRRKLKSYGNEAILKRLPGTPSGTPIRGKRPWEIPNGR